MFYMRHTYDSSSCCHVLNEAHVFHFSTAKSSPYWCINISMFCLAFSERRARARGTHGEWKTEKDPQAENDLFQLPARRSAETLPEGSVPRPARESRAGGSARPHADTGKLRSDRYFLGFCVRPSQEGQQFAVLLFDYA